jgi:hypothetical protein
MVIVIMMLIIVVVMVVFVPAMIVVPPPVRIIVVFVNASASGPKQADAESQKAGQNQQFSQHRFSFAV